MIGVIISSFVTYGLFKLFGRKQTKLVNHLLFWLAIWAIGVIISLSTSPIY